VWPEGRLDADHLDVPQGPPPSINGQVVAASLQERFMQGDDIFVSTLLRVLQEVCLKGRLAAERRVLGRSLFEELVRLDGNVPVWVAKLIDLARHALVTPAESDHIRVNLVAKGFTVVDAGVNLQRAESVQSFRRQLP
jgi:hypothetical protein